MFALCEAPNGRVLVAGGQDKNIYVLQSPTLDITATLRRMLLVRLRLIFLDCDWLVCRTPFDRLAHGSTARQHNIDQP